MMPVLRGWLLTLNSNDITYQIEAEPEDWTASSAIEHPSGLVLSSTGQWLRPLLIVLTIFTALISLFVGVYDLSFSQIIEIIGASIGLTETDISPAVQYLLINIRLPRICLGLLVGAGLSVSGAAIQGLFRNPLADPSLIGITSGGMLFAVGSIFLANTILVELNAVFGYATIGLSAFLGSFLATILIYRLSSYQGVTSVTTMLLAGIAMTAFCGAITGLMTYLSDEDQLRDITFWSLGSLSGATWSMIWVIAGPILGAIFFLVRLARPLDLLMLGEREANYLGISVQKVKRRVILLTAIGVGICVSVCGIISFVALIVPHMLRIISGPTHRALLINAAMLGAILITLADLVARIVIAPAELPIGILTAILGAPFFIGILLKNRSQ